MNEKSPPSFVQEVTQILSQVFLPHHQESLLAQQRIEHVAYDGGEVRIILRLAEEEQKFFAYLKKEIEARLLNLPGVQSLSLLCTHHRPLSSPSPAPSSLKKETAVVAVASGKGGVGKSTTAVHLAVSLAQRGWRVGLLDADVHGPSLPRMMGIHEKPLVTDDKKLIPLVKYGVACLSIGFLISEKGAVIWRGPMVQSALRQLLQESAWGELDVLILDMPPGTGDAQLTVAQIAGLAGAIIVSTPQDIALLDACRGVSFFEKVGVPVVGMIETMSLFHCPHCGHEAPIFGQGGAQEEAARLGVPFWGAIPLEKELRIAGDEGQPLSLRHPSSPAVQAYEAAASFFDQWLRERQEVKK